MGIVVVDVLTKAEEIKPTQTLFSSRAAEEEVVLCILYKCFFQIKMEEDDDYGFRVLEI